MSSKNNTVYTISYNNEILYIGRTNDVKTRMRHHKFDASRFDLF